MAFVDRLLLLTWMLGLLCTAWSQNTGQGISLSVNPPSGKAVPGSDVTFNCTIEVGIIGNPTIEWSRQIGDISNLIAIGTNKENEFVSVGRYKISKRAMVNHRISHILTINGVKMEDSATFKCTVMASRRADSKNLAVCADTSSKSCDCIQNSYGWTSPVCFGESKSDNEIRQSYNTTITGLGVCFAIAVIYGVIITVMFARDCMRIIHQKKKRREMRREMVRKVGTSNPYAESEKLTLDPNDDAASVPESGIWSEGSSNRNSDRQRNSYRGNNPTGNTETTEPIARERPRPKQTHVNAAYNPDDVDGTGAIVIEKPKRNDLKSAMASLDKKPKSSSGFQGAPLTAHTAENTVNPHTPRDHYPEEVVPGGDPYHFPNGIVPGSGAKPKSPPGRPPFPQNVVPPGITQSEGKGQLHPRPAYPVDSREAYTDVTKHHPNHHGQHSNYTEPRKLEFLPQSSDVRPKHSGSYDDGPYIDEHDTEI